MVGRFGELARKAAALSAGEAWLIVRSAALLPAVRVGLQLLPLRRLLQVLEPAPRSRRTARIDARQCARLVAIAARYGPFRGTCLTRSIVLWRLLRREGIPAEIRVGVREGSTPVAAHAWVEVDGAPVNDAADIADTHAVFAERLTP